MDGTVSKFRMIKHEITEEKTKTYKIILEKAANHLSIE